MLTIKDIKKFKKEISKNNSFRFNSQVAKCLSDPSCLKILYILTESKVVCPSEFSEILGLSLPAVSHQLARLKQMEIVLTVRHGQMICYYLTDSKESKLIKKLVKTLTFK